jgi:enterochelin esterase-like enzyme
MAQSSFAYRQWDADEVAVLILGDEIPCQKGPNGEWTATVKSLPSGIHEYTIRIDGMQQIDIHNRWVKKWRRLASLIEVPADPPALTELTEVPHGTRHFHYYHSASTGNQRPAIIYTPPGYSPSQSTELPTVYLLHGNGDDETAWSEVGRAHCILDNLIARKEIEPMIVVMPYGHPVPSPNGEPRSRAGNNTESMTNDVVNDLLPFVEKEYRVSKSSDRRAVVGLSMGGGQAIDIGLKHNDRFAWIGAFSAATPGGDIQQAYPSIANDADSNIGERKLFWIACGKDDFLIERNREFHQTLLNAGVKHTFLETEGTHSWPVWRDYLPMFLKQIFR